MADILRGLGLREVRYQENYREEWRLGEVAFDFDTWPDLPPSSRSKDPTRHRSDKRRPCSTSTTPKPASAASTRSTRARPAAILAEPTLLFADAEKAGAPSAAGKGRH